MGSRWSISAKPEFLVVGQGNPGPEYEATRHNLGFRVLDALQLSFRRGPDYLWASFEGGWLLKPLRYYNASGEVVAPLVRRYGLPPERILVVHDELDLPLGRIQLRKGGSSAGNNGVASLIRALGTPEFHRLRLGVGKPPHPEAGIAWVLGAFDPEELPIVEEIVRLGAEAVRLWAKEGLSAAQERFNGFRLERRLG